MTTNPSSALYPSTPTGSNANPAAAPYVAQPVAPYNNIITNPMMNPLLTPWRQKFPAVLSGIFAFLEFLVTFVIIGCEVGSILIDLFNATIYVGFWASIFLTCAWISQSGASCCCRERGCASYTLVIQCIGLVFAAAVIGFDAYFLSYPTTCFFSSSLCNSTTPLRGVFYSVSNFNNYKIPLLKGQLAAGCVAFTLCLVFIIIYIVTSVRSSKAQNPSAVNPGLPVGPDGLLIAPPVTNIRAQRGASPLYHRPMIALDNGDGRANDLLCPTCQTTMAVTVRKKFPT